MAGDWIKVERSTPDKPEVLRIARELCIDRDAVFGKVMLVWMWFDANSCNGVVDGAVDADVDAVVRHPGFATLMRSVGWLKEAPSGIGLELPNFDRHNGETAKKRALSNRRQSKWRNAVVDGHVDDRPPTNASTREEKRREEKRREEPKKDARKRRALSLPDDFSISARVKTWAEGRGYQRLEAHLEHFIGWARASGKSYADWDQAFMNAIRDDWAKVRANGSTPDYSSVIAGLKD